MIDRIFYSKFLARYEIFKNIININGSIVECGIGDGSGLKEWSILSSIFEPVNHTRKIIGFDSFEGFPNTTDKDNAKKGQRRFHSYNQLKKWIKEFDKNRFINHIQKVEIIKGNAIYEMEKYLSDNPHLLISLLNLDFDIYEPTIKALNLFVPRMPKGSIIIFDELNMKKWKGETIALLEYFKLNNLHLQRFPFTSTLSYCKI